MTQVSFLGTSALLFEAPGETSLGTQQRIWALAREALVWPEAWLPARAPAWSGPAQASAVPDR